MDNLNEQIRFKILEYLRKKPMGASSSEISKVIGHNRITVTKYLEIMLANNVLLCEDVAQARLWRINEKKGKPSILVVDDDHNVVDLIALSLARGKYNITKAYSGLDALDRVYQENPDLIILDLMMPGVDGYEVCKRLKQSPITKHIPVVMLSAKGEVGDKLKGLNIGADDYITKPFDPMELEARVNALLRRVKQDLDMHPLTKLPGILSLEMDVKARLDSGKKFHVYSFTLANMEDYRRIHGYHKTEDVVLLISRMFSEAISTSIDTFMAHTLNDNFIVVCASQESAKRIRQSFESVYPYIYSNGMDEKPITLQETEIESSRINKAEELTAVLKQI